MSHILPSHVDVLIVGGGPVGGALALALEDSGLSVLVVEARSTPADDPRALAVAHACVAQLGKLGIALPDSATAIHTVHVSQALAFGRVRLDRQDLDLPALGYVLPYKDLARAMHARLAESRVHYVTGATVSSVQSLSAYAAVTLQHAGNSELITARLVVLAEGGKLLEKAGLAQGGRDYQQKALLAQVTASQPHQHRAFERFAFDGPIALLPSGPGDAAAGRYALVWTRPLHDALAIEQMPDAQLLDELQVRMGDRAGRFTGIGTRVSFPLRLKWVSTPYMKRIAVVGNAAQTLHPVAGQGFNLGLRDAMALSRVIRASGNAALGETSTLQRYAALRNHDSLTTIGFTDGLIRLFGKEMAPLRAARAFGFVAMDNIKPLRRGFAARMVFGN